MNSSASPGMVMADKDFVGAMLNQPMSIIAPEEDEDSPPVIEEVEYDDSILPVYDEQDLLKEVKEGEEGEVEEVDDDDG